MKKQSISLLGEKGKFTIVNKGLSRAFKSELSVKYLYIVLFASIFFALYHEHDDNKRFQLILVSLLVFASELVNTAIEAVVDRISFKRHILSGYAKDLASTVTVVWAFFYVYVWSKWFYNKWLEYKDGESNFFANKEKTMIVLALSILASLPFVYIIRIILRISNMLYTFRN